MKSQISTPDYAYFLFRFYENYQRHGAVIHKFSLAQEGEEISLDVNQSDVEAALLQIHPRHRSFYILSRDDESYIQVAGAKLRLIIEFRQVENDSFRHFVLGRHSGETKMVSINYSGGIIQLQKNEILQIEDAIKIMSSFMKSGIIPPEYHPREITDDF